MAIFNFLRWRPSAILDLQKFKILTAGTVRRVNAKFGADQTINCGDMAIFRFFKMAAIL